MRVYVLISIMACALCGCYTVPSKGGIALIDLDFRTAEQIRAAQEPLMVPQEKVLPLSFWAGAFKMLTELECRLRLGVYEWDTNPEL